jgi:hypothetical protein
MDKRMSFTITKSRIDLLKACAASEVQQSRRNKGQSFRDGAKNQSDRRVTSEIEKLSAAGWVYLSKHDSGAGRMWTPTTRGHELLSEHCPGWDDVAPAAPEPAA